MLRLRLRRAGGRLRRCGTKEVECGTLDVGCWQWNPAPKFIGDQALAHPINHQLSILPVKLSGD